MEGNTRSDPSPWPAAAGEMADRVSAFDWAATPLGPLENWPPSLKTVVDLMLRTPQPATLAVGSDRIFLYNDEAAQLYGSRHPAVFGTPLGQAFEHEFDQVTAFYDRVFAGESVHVPAQALDPAKTGALEVFETYLTPVHAADDSVIAAYVTVTTTISKLRAEGALRESEQRFRAFVTATSDVVYRMSADWSEMRQLDGRGFLSDTAEPTGSWMDGYIPPGDQPAVREAIERAVRSETPFELEHRVIRADGTAGWTASRAVPIRGADGQITEWLGAAADVTARKQTQQALHESEEEYRTLFESIDQGFCTIEMRFDGQGRPVDYVFLNTNRAFLAQAGFGDEHIIGQNMRTFAPDHEKFWFETYGRVARTGRPERFEHEAAAIGRWYNVFAFRPKEGAQDQVAVLFEDITARKHIEAELREREERQAFLLRLSDKLRPLTDALEIQSAAVELVGRHLGASRTIYALVGGKPGGEQLHLTGQYVRVGAPMPEVVDAQAFGTALVNAMLRGEWIGIADTATDPRVPDADRDAHRLANIASYGCVSLMKHGRAVAVLSVHSDTPREWTASEATLLSEVADRTWDAVERARAEAALRESEEKHRTLFNTMGQGYCEHEIVRDETGRAIDLRLLEANPRWGELTGLPRILGSLIRDHVPDAELSWVEAYDSVVRTGVPARFENEAAALGRWYEVYAYPRGGDRFALLVEDITERKRSEMALLESEERQAFLLKLSDALRPLADPAEIQDAATRVLGEHLRANRVAYVRVTDDEYIIEGDYVDGVPSMAGRFRVNSFGTDKVADYQEGRTRGGRDTEKDAHNDPVATSNFAAFGVAAGIGVPLIKGGRFVATLVVHMSEPRDWSLREVVLAEETAERTWAAIERAQAEAALRESEARLAAAFESVPAGIAVNDTAGETVIANSLYRGFLPTGVIPSRDPPGVQRWQAWDEQGCAIDAHDFPSARALSGESVVPGQEMLHTDITGRETWTQVAAVPVRDADGRITGIATVISDIDAKKRAETALRESEQALAADLAGASLLRDLSERLGTEEDLATIHEEILAAAIAIMRSDGGTIQVYEPGTRSLILLVTRGFDPRMTGHFHRVNAASETACGFALRQGRRTFIDFDRDEMDEADRMHVAAGYRSAQATPLLSRAGAPLGMLNTHWRESGHRPTERELRFLDLLARQAADLIERAQAQRRLRESEERLRQFGDASQDVLWIRDADTLQWVYLTPAFEHIYGLTRQEALTGDNYRNWQDLIIPEDRERATGAIARVRAGEHVTFEYRVRRPGDGTIRWVRNTDFPITDETGKVVLIGGIGHDFTEFRETEQRFRTLVEGIPQLVWRAIDGGEWTWASPQWTQCTGQKAAEYVDWGWLTAVHPADRNAAREAWARALDDGGFEVEYRIRRQIDAEYRWFQTRATPVRDQTGVITEWLGTSTDVHELRGLQELQKTLLAELQHRVRNILAVTRSIVSRSDNGERDTKEYVQHLLGRISALARTQVLLTRKAGAGVDLKGLIRDELLAQVADESPFALDGPDVKLSAKATEVLTLAVHELATNATKYGAFSRASGRLTVRWQIEERDHQIWLSLDWLESGVPIVDAFPRRRGFGAELVSRRIPYELKGHGSLELKPGGLVSHIEFPLVPGDSILQTDGVSV